VFGASTGIGLEKREERGLVRATILRRCGAPKMPRTSPVKPKIPVTTAVPGSCPGNGTFEPSTGQAPPLFAVYIRASHGGPGHPLALTTERPRGIVAVDPPHQNVRLVPVHEIGYGNRNSPEEVS